VIVVDPTTIAFGSVRVTQSDTKPVTITNGGAAALIITSISDPGGQFSIVNKPNTPITIQSTQSITINVRFAPIFVGPVNASFTISSNDPTNPTVFVNLSGTGTGAPVPNLVLNPGAVEFASGAPPAMIELSNTGEADLIITTILPPPTPFSLSGSGTGVIKTGEKKTITVTFTPTSLGVFINGFTIVSNDPDSLLTFVPLKGTNLQQVAIPRVINLEFKKRGLRFLANGSNVVSGATLIVDGTETFTLEQSDDLWLVLKGTRSTPGNKRIRDIFLSPSTHTVVVKNPNGATSTTVTITV
jgi:hypothetical protein